MLIIIKISFHSATPLSYHRNLLLFLNSFFRSVEDGYETYRDGLHIPPLCELISASWLHPIANDTIEFHRATTVEALRIEGH